MTTHRYRVGEMVYFTSPTRGLPASAEPYEIVRILPRESGGLSYRIKTAAEAFERVANESDITAQIGR